MRLSIIIPLGPGEAVPQELLTALGNSGEPVEKILACCESPPRPLEPGLGQTQSAPGRGCQQNAGAAIARGKWLWFLHADSRLGGEALDKVLQFIDGSEALGYCRLRFAADGPALTRLNALGANLRSRWLGLPYGDQGLCLPATWFHRLGGFREDLDRGEDLDLVVRAAGAGLSPRCMGPTVITSARRYQDQGWLRTTLAHQRAAWRLIQTARQSA